MTDEQDGVPPIERREWLAITGGSLPTAFAGCLGGDDADSETGNGTRSDDGGGSGAENDNESNGTESGSGDEEGETGDGDESGSDDGNDDDGKSSDDEDEENGEDDENDGSNDDGSENELASLGVTVYTQSKSEKYLAESGELFVWDNNDEFTTKRNLADGADVLFGNIGHDTYTLETKEINGEPLLDGSREVVLEKDTSVDFITASHGFPGADSYRFTLYEYRVYRDPDPSVTVQNQQFLGFGTTAANGERFLMYDDSGGSPQHIYPDESPLPWGTDFTEVDLEFFVLNTRQQVTEDDTTYHRRVTDASDIPEWEVLDKFNGHIRWTDELSRFQVVKRGLYDHINETSASLIENHGKTEINGETLHLYEIQDIHHGERVYLDPDTGYVRRWEIEEEPVTVDPDKNIMTEEIRLAIVEFKNYNEFSTLEDEIFAFESGFDFQLANINSE